jgi:hypothetical protein
LAVDYSTVRGWTIQKLSFRLAFMQATYFMSQTEQDAVVGRVAREHAEAVRNLAILEAELAKQRELYARLAEKLGELDCISFDGEQSAVPVPDAVGWRTAEYSFSSDAIDGHKLKTLCKEIMEARAKQNRLAAQLKSMGL